MLKDLGFCVSSFLSFGFLFSTMTFANYDTYFSFGCETNHEEIETLIFNDITNESQQLVSTMDKTPITKLMIKGVEVDVD
jgi:hypothetical protein